MSGVLVLEDGEVFAGESVGARGFAFGEAVFTTSMSGYQEVATDPSFEGQLVCFTAPMVGNYGVADARDRSRSRTHAKGVLMREARGPQWTDWLHEHGVVALTGVDTRSLVLHLRERGAMRAAVVSERPTPTRCSPPFARNRRWPARRSSPASRPSEQYTFAADGAVRVAVVDYGCKRSILRRLAASGAAVDVFPHDVDADTIAGYDGVLLSPGPGDPVAARGETNDGPRAARAHAGARRLPRPSAARARDRPARRSSCRSAIAVRTIRCSTAARSRVLVTAQNHGFAVETADDANVTHTLALRRHRRRARLPRAACAVGAVPPRGVAGPARRGVDHRRVGSRS